MSESTYEFGFGKGKIAVTLPDDKILYNLKGKSVPAVTDVWGAAKEAMRNPIGTKPLKEIVNPGESVCIVVSDITRSWIRTRDFLPAIVDELNEAGVPDKDIFLLVSTGSHRISTTEENVLNYGQAIVDRIRIYQHDSTDDDNMVHIGTTRLGVDIRVNRLAVDADRVILTGAVVLHPIAGYSGGRKSVMPGITALDTIYKTHSYCLHETHGMGMSKNSQAGKLEGNPVHEFMTEACAFLNPDFIFNTVQTPEGEFASFHCGHWYQAWEDAVSKVKEIYGAEFSEKADLVIVSTGGYPNDINIYQSTKTIGFAHNAVKSGGAIIIFLEGSDIYDPPEFADFLHHYDSAFDLEMAARKEFSMPAYLSMKWRLIADDATVIVVSLPENVPYLEKARLNPARSFEEALEIAEKKLGKDYTVTLLAKGAKTVPIYTGTDY
ncbi:MAG TPA: nickel-dependent lactate racemase [Anaerovoracaceae bacterium]|nr:nickel-dependent lactate racemase [Anaerovoracaceae bacterium]